jgi:hypothetical protein
VYEIIEFMVGLKQKIITCPHKTHLIFNTDTRIRFPIRKYAKKLKSQGKILRKEALLKLVDLFGVWPPKDRRSYTNAK